MPTQDAEATLVEASRRPEFARAAQAFVARRLPEAERGARAILTREPENPAALLLLSEIANAAGVPAESLMLLQRAAALLPGHVETQVRLAELMQRQGHTASALELLDRVVAARPDYSRAVTARLTMLAQTGDYDAAEQGFRDLVARDPGAPGPRLRHAHLLKTLGRLAESAAAFREALALDPSLAEAWWGLADLKSGLLDASDVAAMRDLLARTGLRPDQVLHLHFALGSALEDAADYPASFRHYDEGNRIARRLRPHDADVVTDATDRSIALFDAAFFDRRRGWGSPSRAPVFILGMPRSGSTLLEQMLASHPAIEGTAELPYVPQAAHELVAERWPERDVRYPEVVGTVDAARAERLATGYLARASVHRRTDRPFFIDKLNDNWPYVGLIHLMFPNAVVIDVRRDAMACCFSNWKQLYANGRLFSYGQAAVARYYRDYVRFMDHIDRVLPGRVHRVRHDRLVADPEGELRRLLGAMGLPFDAACLRFHENARPVRTASAAQVRRPLDSRVDEQWRNYRPWLGEMEKELGPLASG